MRRIKGHASYEVSRYGRVWSNKRGHFLKPKTERNAKAQARRYGVTTMAINHIFQGRTWSWLTGITPRKGGR